MYDGSKIRALRALRGLSGASVSEALDKHQDWCGRIERGDTRLSLDDALRLVELLGVHIDDIVRDDDE